MKMCQKIIFIGVLILLQVASVVHSVRTVHEVSENFSEIIYKLTEQVKNYTDFAYGNCSEQVMLVLQNNSLEITEAKSLIREMYSAKENLLSDSGMTFLPHLTRECEDNFDEEAEKLSTMITNSENVCLIFMSNVFTLVENPELYKNMTELKLQIEGIKSNCTITISVDEADDCFRREINIEIEPRLREMKWNIQQFLATVERKVQRMMNTVHRCYNIIKIEVLMKKLRSGIRNFQQCLENKKEHQ